MKAVNSIMKKSILFLSLVFVILMGCKNNTSNSSEIKEEEGEPLYQYYLYGGRYQTYDEVLKVVEGDEQRIYIGIVVENESEYLKVDNPNLSFSCSDESIVSILHPKGEETFSIKCNKPGTVAITIKYYKEVKTINIQVLEKVALSINKGSIEMFVDQTETIELTVSPDTCSDKSVTWSSDNTDVVTVDSNGKITAVAQGTANITVVSNINCFATQICDVTVRLPSEIIIDMSGGGVDINGTRKICTAYPGYVGELEASLADLSPTTFTWTSSNPDAVSVDSEGIVTYKGAGDLYNPAKATITCTAENGESASVECWSSFYPGFTIGGRWADFDETYKLSDFGTDYRIFIYSFNSQYEDFSHGFTGNYIYQTNKNVDFVKFESSNYGVINFKQSGGDELMILNPVSPGEAEITITVKDYSKKFKIIVE